LAPRAITLDGYAASHRAVREMKADGQLAADTKLRSSKYMNNEIEQDHCGVKLRIGPMLGFQRFRTAAVTIAGIELLRRIREGQFNLAASISSNRTSFPAKGGIKFICEQRTRRDNAPSSVFYSAGCWKPGVAAALDRAPAIGDGSPSGGLGWVCDGPLSDREV
jgi:DDE domain